MSKIFFKLNGVPDDEAHDVRALLKDNAIDFFETSGGNWGVSMPAIWLTDAAQFSKARALLDEYQKTRTMRMREEYNRLKKTGKHKTFLDTIKEKPVLFIVYLTLTVLIIYLSAQLVIDMGKIGLKE